MKGKERLELAEKMANHIRCVLELNALDGSTTRKARKGFVIIDETGKQYVVTVKLLAKIAEATE
jgi:hypothetical protein